METGLLNRAVLLRWVKQHHPSKLRWIRENVTVEGFSGGFKRVQQNFDERRQNTYLFCTSAGNEGLHPKCNLYLWGHYGLGHRGVALEFKTAHLARDVLAHSDPEGRLNLETSDLWVKVDYKAQVTPLSPEAYFNFVVSGFPTGDRRESPGYNGIWQFLERTLRTKHTVWRLENEWRLLWTSDSGGDIYHCPVSRDSIVGIYLGLRIDGPLKKDLLTLVRSKMSGVPVFEAKKTDGNFALEWSRIA